MKNIVEYARFLAKELMGVQIDRQQSSARPITSSPATAGAGSTSEPAPLGHRWFDQGATEEVDQLLIHEFGHQYSSDHLSEDYHDALCRLGAGMKRLAMEKPEELRRAFFRRRGSHKFRGYRFRDGQPYGV